MKRETVLIEAETAYFDINPITRLIGGQNLKNQVDFRFKNRMEAVFSRQQRVVDATKSLEPILSDHKSYPLFSETLDTVNAELTTPTPETLEEESLSQAERRIRLSENSAAVGILTLALINSLGDEVNKAEAVGLAKQRLADIVVSKLDTLPTNPILAAQEVSKDLIESENPATLDNTPLNTLSKRNQSKMKNLENEVKYTTLTSIFTFLPGIAGAISAYFSGMDKLISAGIFTSLTGVSFATYATLISPRLTQYIDNLSHEKSIAKAVAKLSDPANTELHSLMSSLLRLAALQHQVA